MLQLDSQDLAIPAGLLGELVVGEDVGPLLRLREVRESQAGHGIESERLRRRPLSLRFKVRAASR